jgi:hypothetical protein
MLGILHLLGRGVRSIQARFSFSHHLEPVPRRLPQLNALKAFEAAARHISFTRAAEELCGRNETSNAMS